MSLLVLLACARVPDSQRYAAALVASVWSVAHADCAAIAAEPSRSDCLVAIAQSHGRGIGDCADIRLDAWAEECRFMYAERTGRGGEFQLAFSTCDTLPRFSHECNYHLISQALDERILTRTPAQVAGAFARYAKSPVAEQLFWAAYFRERFTSGVPVSAAGCPTPACFAGATEAQRAEQGGVAAPMGPPIAAPR